MTSTLERELHRHFKALTPSHQQQVLQLARDLTQMPLKGTPGTTLLRFAGTIAPEDLQSMQQAIEADCATVDVDAW